MGTKPPDKVAIAPPRGWVLEGDVSPSALPEANVFVLMFSDMH